jgi:hypothetical protein
VVDAEVQAGAAGWSNSVTLLVLLMLVLLALGPGLAMWG